MQQDGEEMLLLLRHRDDDDRPRRLRGQHWGRHHNGQRPLCSPPPPPRPPSGLPSALSKKKAKQRLIHPTGQVCKHTKRNESPMPRLLRWNLLLNEGVTWWMISLNSFKFKFRDHEKEEHWLKVPSGKTINKILSKKRPRLMTLSLTFLLQVFGQFFFLKKGHYFYTWT